MITQQSKEGSKHYRLYHFFKKGHVVMKKFKKLCAMILVGGCLISMSACGGGDAYSGYNSAYRKMSETGSLNVLFSLEVDDGTQSMSSTGNMKMNAQNEVYYEMTINGKDIMQYVQDGEVHTFVDGQEQVTSTSNTDRGVDRANPEGGQGEPNEKTDNTGFNSAKFLEEFSGILEAGKIKEMGVMDPISKNYISKITSSQSGSDTVYTMTFPEEFLKVLLNKMVKEQMQSSGGTLSFDSLKDFECIAKENSSGYLYSIEYKGYTTVTVPGDYTNSGEAETFDLHIDLVMEIQNPGTAVEVVIPE